MVKRGGGRSGEEEEAEEQQECEQQSRRAPRHGGLLRTLEAGGIPDWGEWRSGRRAVEERMRPCSSLQAGSLRLSGAL